MAIGSPPKRLTTSFHFKQHVRFSPDGSHVVYARTIGPRIRLMKVGSQGGEELPLFPDRKDDYIQQHPALVLLVAPDRDHHLVAAARRVVDHKAPLADHPSVGVCWNSNDTDLAGAGFDANFDLVKDKINAVHMRDLFLENYPMLSVIGIVSWEWLPFAKLILLTALQSLSSEHPGSTTKSPGKTPLPQ